MAGISKEELARYSGAEWLLRLAKEKGIEEAEKELTERNIRGIPLAVKKSDLDKLYENERVNLTLCMILISAATLHDEFEFDVENLNQFIHRFNLKSECLCSDYVTWQELQQTIKEETGILIPLPERR